jgi:hypothetical protein
MRQFTHPQATFHLCLARWIVAHLEFVVFFFRVFLERKPLQLSGVSLLPAVCWLSFLP